MSRFTLTRTERRVVIGINLALIAVLLSVGLPVAKRARHTCVICRATRADYTYVGFKWSESQDTVCTAWYSQNVEPTHEHVWMRHPSTVLLNSYFKPIGAATNSGREPLVLRFEPSEQVEIYNHFDDPLSAKRLFVELATQEPTTQRVYFETLRDWIGSGFEGSWEDVDPHWKR